MDILEGTDPKHLQKTLAAMGLRLESAYKLMSAVASLTAIPITDRGLSEAAGEILNTLVLSLEDLKGCSIMLFDSEAEVLRLLAARGPADVVGESEGPYNKNLIFRPGEGIAGKVFQRNVPIFTGDDPAEINHVDSARSVPKALACFPLSPVDECIGVINISFYSRETLSKSRRRDLFLLSGVVANIIQAFLLKEELDHQAESLRDKVMECEVEISERKKVEKALSLTQFSVDSMADEVFWIGDDGRFLYVNKAACEKLGYGQDELLGMNIHDIDLDFPQNEWNYCLEKLRSCKSFTLESRHYTKAGDPIPVEIMLSHLEFEGREYNIAFARDITERKIAEKELKEAKNKLETILSGASDGIYALSTTGRVVFANEAAARSFGYDSARQMMDDPYSEDVLKKMEITDESGNPVPVENLPGRLAPGGCSARDLTLRFRQLNSDEGSWSVVKARPIYDENQNVYLSVIIRHDITEIKKSQEERERLINELTKALAEVKKLQGFIPICAKCKKIRDDKGFWQQIEKYIQERSEAIFSHSICPQCVQELYPDLYPRLFPDQNNEENEKK